MASPQAEAFHQVLRQFREAALGSTDTSAPGLDDIRANSAATADAFTTMPDGVTVTDIELPGGLQAQWVVPDGAAPDRVVMYVHGGAYVILSMRSHTKLVAHIAKAAGCRVLNVDYRLAPEHPHPAAVDDALAAYRWLLDQGFAPGKVAISGDSAGGGLTVATLLAAKAAGVPQPGAAVPLSPWTDLEGVGESMTTNADKDLIVDQAGLRMMAALYIDDHDPRSPLIAPIYADLSGLAPMYIQVGGHETLLDDSTRLAVAVAHAGGDVRLDVFPEMQHVFQMGAGNLPEADDAIRRIGDYLRARLT